jgi:protein SCO1/2
MMIFHKLRRNLSLLTCLSLAMLLDSKPVWAQGPLPQDLVRQVNFEQKLDEQVPLDLSFVDSTGQQVRLGDYLGQKPVILSLGYYECPMLCSLARHGLFESLKALDFSVGEEFELAIVSIDPRETPEIAEMKRQSSLMEYGRSRSGEGWNFLVGQEPSIQALAEAIGFHYAYDPKVDQYAHPSGIVILTPEGKIARYFYGIDYPARDLRLGLVEAADSKIGSPIDQLLLMCYHYDPVSGEYTLLIMNIIRAAGIFMVVIVAGFVYFLFKRDPNRRAGPIGQAYGT